MHIYRWLFVVGLSGAVILRPTISAALPADDASSLFNQAVPKMQTGQFSEACPLLEKSYQIDPKPGTLFTLANCRDSEGKLAAASERYAEYARAYAAMKDVTERDRHASRVAHAEARLVALQSEVPTLKFLWDEKAQTIIKVWIDQVELSASALNSPLPFDPGPHEIVVQWPGQADEKRIVTLEKGRSTVLDISTKWLMAPKFESPDALRATPVQPAKPIAAPKHRTNPRRTAGFIMLGLGGAGLAFGGVMGAIATAEKQTVKAHCTGGSGYDCDATGFASVEKMRSYAPPSTIGFIAGGTLAAIGLVLVVTAPKLSNEKTATIRLHAGGAPGNGFVGVEGAF